MKGGLFIFIILFSSLFFIADVTGESKTGIILNQGDNITIAGRTIKFLSGSENSASFWIDGFGVNAFYNQTKKFRGVTFFIQETHSNIVIVDITVDQVCGDNICSQDEYCCADCGCNPGFACISNQCLDSTLNKCNNASDCSDTNNCTIDKCSGYPTACVHEDIIECTSDDQCCPSSCNETNDMDCKKCGLNECYTGTECLTEGSVKNNRYCLGSQLNNLKTFDQLCENDFECFSEKCQNKRCTKESDKQLDNINNKSTTKDYTTKKLFNSKSYIIAALVISLAFLFYIIIKKIMSKQ